MASEEWQIVVDVAIETDAEEKRWVARDLYNSEMY